VGWILAGLVIFFAGCAKEPEPAGTGEKGTKSPKVSAAPSAEVLALLARADAKDGKTDKVVSKCASCTLSMDGNPDFAAKIGEYQLHFCSDHCRENFQADPEKALADALKPK
jgi:hypothetical protein